MGLFNKLKAYMISSYLEQSYCPNFVWCLTIIRDSVVCAAPKIGHRIFPMGYVRMLSRKIGCEIDIEWFGYGGRNFKIAEFAQGMARNMLYCNCISSRITPSSAFSERRSEMNNMSSHSRARRWSSKCDNSFCVFPVM